MPKPPPDASGAVSPAKMRRDQRFPVEVPIVLQVGNQIIEVHTEDVSFGGVFVYTDIEARPGQLIHVDMMLPPKGERFTVAGMLVHNVQRGRRPGVGLRFYGVDRERQAVWDRFVSRLRDEFPSMSGRAVRQAVGERFDPLRPRSKDHEATLRVAVRTPLDLLVIYKRDFEKGEVFLLTDEELAPGVQVGLQIVHPSSDHVFELSGTVTRRVSQHGIAGLSIQFDALDDERRQRFYEFIYDGIADMFDEDSIDASF